jgi:hypothetical protein
MTGLNAPAFTGIDYCRRLGNDGTFLAGGDRYLVYRNGITKVSPGMQSGPEELEIQRIPDRSLRGRPASIGDRAYLAQRTTGRITVLEMSESGQPNLLEQFTLPGNPGRIRIHQGRMVIANRYEGLWRERR